jgi:hypothetical protein
MTSCLLSCIGVFVRIHYCLASLGISCVASHSSLSLCLMSSLPKGESMGTKLVELFANRVVERRILIMTIYGGELALRVLGGVDSGRVFEFVSFFVLLSFS